VGKSSNERTPAGQYRVPGAGCSRGVICSQRPAPWACPGAIGSTPYVTTTPCQETGDGGDDQQREGNYFLPDKRRPPEPHIHRQEPIWDHDLIPHHHPAKTSPSSAPLRPCRPATSLRSKERRLCLPSHKNLPRRLNRCAGSDDSTFPATHKARRASPVVFCCDETTTSIIAAISHLRPNFCRRSVLGKAPLVEHIPPPDRRLLM